MKQMRKHISTTSLILLFLSIIIIPINSFGDEILFRNIPWGSSPDILEKELLSAGYKPYIGIGPVILLDKYTQESDFSGLTRITTETQCGWACSASCISSEKKPTVADYEVLSIYLNFYSTIDGDVVNLDRSAANLYFVKYAFSITDYDIAFDELSTKLTNLYGDFVSKEGKTYYPVDGRMAVCDTIRHFYYGDNNSVVILEKASYDDKGVALELSYGQTGHDEHIAQCDALLKLEKITNNTDEA